MGNFKISLLFNIALACEVGCRLSVYQDGTQYINDKTCFCGIIVPLKDMNIPRYDISTWRPGKTQIHYEEPMPPLKTSFYKMDILDE